MANYKKQLKDGDGNNIYPAQGLGTITSDNIDWSSLPQSMSGTTQSDFKGYFDIGDIRIQYYTGYKTGLNTGSTSYNGWSITWPVAFANNYYMAMAAPMSDTGNVAGGEFKVYARTTTGCSLNYNHTGQIGQGNMHYSVFAIGRKPTS